jgi:cytochrome c556
MRVGKWGAAALVVIWTAVVAGQTQTQKVTTPAEFDKVMKAVNQTNGQINKAIKSGAYADAKAALAVLRQHFEAAGTFWETHKKDDVLKLNKDALAKIDALDKVLAGAPADTTAIQTAHSTMGATCRACHKENRAQDDAGNYIIRPGVIGG